MPDYSLAEELSLTDPAQYRALFEPTRQQIVSLLLERAATTSELAEVLRRPKGTVGHHLQVLAAAGLVHVVRTERVRALQAKYYGRTARVFLYQREHQAVGHESRLIESALAGLARVPKDAPVMTVNQRFARVPAERAEEWQRRLEQLLMEFAAEPAQGDTTYALLFALYPTERAPLPGSGS